MIPFVSLLLPLPIPYTSHPSRILNYINTPLILMHILLDQDQELRPTTTLRCLMATLNALTAFFIQYISHPSFLGVTIYMDEFHLFM
jgi:hypothetical protein